MAALRCRWCPWAVAGLSLAACAPDVAAPFPAGAPTTVAFQTEHFTYYADTQVCEAVGERLEAQYREVFEFLDATESASHQFRYFHYTDSSALDETCGGSNWGCVRDDTDVLSDTLLFRRLVAQAVAAGAGDPPVFFREGISQVLGPWHYDGDVNVSHAIDLGEQVRDPTSIYLGPPGSFVRGMVDSFGLEAFRQYYATADSSAGWAATRKQFEEAFGVPLEREIASWEAAPDTYRGDIYLWLDECDYPPLDPSSGPVADLRLPLDCGGVPLDANHSEGSVGSFRSLQLDAGAGVRATLRSDVFARVEVAGCDHYVEGERGVSVYPPEGDVAAQVWFDVPGGDYFLNLFEYQVDGIDSGTTTLGLELAAMPVASTCDAAGEVVLDETVSDFHFVVSSVGRSGVAHVWLQSPGGGNIEVGGHYAPLGHGLADQYMRGAQLCSGACGTLTCSAIDVWLYTGNFTLPPGERMLLRAEFEPDSHARIDLARN